MTFREKLMQEHPEQCGEHFGGGCQGCPRDYGYHELRLCSIESMTKGDANVSYDLCAACWNQQMPENGPKREDFRGADAPRNDRNGGNSGAPESSRPTMAQGDVDMVNRPPHYTAGGIECIDAIEAALSSHKDAMSAWLTGQVLKYLWRWPLKNGVEDLKKARFYLERLIEREDGK